MSAGDEPSMSRSPGRRLQHRAGRGKEGSAQGTVAAVRSHSQIEVGRHSADRQVRCAGRSVAVFTEALGAQPHHGRVAMLVNEHSASAAEMVAGFASEYRLATLVGTKTPGRLVATSAFKVGHGFRVVMPVATYYTWKGDNLEGKGVVPTIEEPFSFEASVQGRDNQLEAPCELFARQNARPAPPCDDRFRSLLFGERRSAPSRHLASFPHVGFPAAGSNPARTRRTA